METSVQEMEASSENEKSELLERWDRCVSANSWRWSRGKCSTRD